MNFQNNEIKKTKTNVFLSVFVFIFMSSDTFLFGTNSNTFVKNIGYVAMFLCVLYWSVCFISKKIKVQSATVLAFCILCGVLFLNILTVSGMNIKVLYTLMLHVLTFFFCSCVSKNEFVQVFKSILIVFATFSIVSYVIYTLAYPIIELLPAVTNENGVLFYFAGLEVFPAQGQHIHHRSFGVFREPGVYIAFLLWALSFELFFEKKPCFKNIVILITVVILTRSTAGYIVLLMMIAIYAFTMSKGKYAKKIKKVILALFAIMAVYLVIDGKLLETVFVKLFVENASKSSRLDSIRINVTMLCDNLEYLFVGLGHEFVEKRFASYAMLLGSSATDNTNTIFRMMSTYGIIYVFTLLFSWFSFFKKGKRFVVGFGLFLAMILILFNENMMMNPILYIIAFYMGYDDTVLRVELT